jgi:hypothetical protein
MAARHGAQRRYNEGCHCGDCTAANTAYQQEYRQRLTAVTALSVPVTRGRDVATGFALIDSA